MLVRECDAALSSSLHKQPLNDGRCVQVTSGRDHWTFTCTPALEHSLLQANVKLGDSKFIGFSKQTLHFYLHKCLLPFHNWPSFHFVNGCWRLLCMDISMRGSDHIDLRVVFPFHCQKTHDWVCRACVTLTSGVAPAHPKCLALVHCMNYTPMHMHIHMYMYIQYESKMVALLSKEMLLQWSNVQFNASALCNVLKFICLLLIRV